MNPQDPGAPQSQPPAYNPDQPVSNTLTVTQPGEKVICEIKRHPVGILAIYFMCALVLLLVGGLTFWIGPNVSSSISSKQVNEVGTVILLLLAFICVVYSLIATKVYWGNSWVVTSDSVTQIDQISLFNRQSSQLSLANLEDVSAEQNGILAHMFGYGLLRVETAGERSKFVFTYCPNPNYYAQQILAAREAFAQAHPSPHGGGGGVNVNV
jgi:uncharacterized membrane protein YdbT with pleckstrin-like domain